MKAFLSHSSENKEFVEAVANELGRQFSVFDKQSFAGGEDFKVSIERGLDESALFVLFVSKSSLKSLWVEFEVEEAWYQRLSQNLKKSLVYLMDSSVSHSDLPRWLQRALVQRATSPKVVARDIRFNLDELLRQRQHPYFFGRSQEVDDVEQALTPYDGSFPPRCLFVAGLPGVGRRSLIRNTAPKILNLKKQVEVRIGEEESINDICTSVADRVEPYSTKAGFEHLFRQIQLLSSDEALARLMRDLAIMVSNGELPIFVDEGGLLDSEGFITDTIRTILKAVSLSDEVYLFFVSPRRPQKEMDVSLPVVQIQGLRENETKRLVSALANQAGLVVSPNDISELAAYVAGYPPAAYFTVQQIKDYGIGLVMRDKTHLVQFRTSVFVRHFSKFSLDEVEQGVLRILAAFSPLPLSILAEVFSKELNHFEGTIIRLIDLALVVTTESGYYRIADPIVDAVTGAFGFPSDDEYKRLALKLAIFLQQQEIESSRLELSRVLFRVARLAKNKEVADATIHLANDLIRLVERFYHARKYQEAVEMGFAALEERPLSINARDYLIRALIQEERYSDAEEQLEHFHRVALPQDYHFLIGFLERNRGQVLQAITAYKESARFGRRGASLSRELAYCYFIADDLPEAARHIKLAMSHHSDNRYVVDLWAQIATRQRDEPAVRQALSKLEILDKPIYYYHRLSRVEFAFGHMTEALAAAHKAAESEGYPPFEILSHLVYCEIEVGQLDEAEGGLQLLDKRFGHIRHDIRLGLRCRLEIARGQYSEALVQSERMRDKSTFFYKKIRHDALHGELQASVLKDSTRIAYVSELERLDEKLSQVLPEQFIPAFAD